MAKRQVPSLNSFWKADIVDFHEVRKREASFHASRYICENPVGRRSGHEIRVPPPRARVSAKTWSKNYLAIQECDLGGTMRYWAAPERYRSSSGLSCRECHKKTLHSCLSVRVQPSWQARSTCWAQVLETRLPWASARSISRRRER